jgi:hypothetical protein
MFETIVLASAIVLLPADANPNTTPFTSVDNVWVPEESPTGTYPTGQWLDNSPLYAGGWYLQVNDATRVVTWKTVEGNQSDYATDVPDGK